MTQDQNQSVSSVQQPKRKGRGLQFVFIGSALLVLMVLAVGIREFVSGEGGSREVSFGSLPTMTTEIDEQAWASQSDTIAGKFLASRHAERTGNFGAAADLLLEILAIQPDNFPMVVRAHVLLVGEGRFEEARDLAESILEEDPDNSLANLTVAMKLVEEDAYEDALAHILRIPHQGANTLLVPMLEGWILAGMGEIDTAYDTFAQLGRNNTFISLKGLHAGMLADMLGDPVRAEEEFALALGDGESLPLRVAQVYLSLLTRQDRWDEAASFFERYAEQNQDNLLGEPMFQAVENREIYALPVTDARAGIAESFYSVANVLNSGAPDIQPLVYIRYALNFAPADPRSLFLLGDILGVQEREDDAIEAFRQIDQSSPFWWYARMSIATSMADGDSGGEEAVRMLEEMVDERPQRADAPRALGDIQRIDENWVEAVAAYDIAVERIDELEERHWQLLYTRGISLERSSISPNLSDQEQAATWDRAEVDFLAALELNPDQPNVLNYLGYSWVEKGRRLDEAREMIERSVSQRPRDGYITDSMGWVLYRMQEFDEAVVFLERAVELEPSDPIVNDHLGDVYWLIGRRNEARFQWNRALNADPDEDLASQIRAKLSGEVEPEPRPPGDDSEI